ncbi:unnamed protein product [Angiostrongylus costaricensis]|uniref:MFS domain-containing protein n=1 Tax=Angiostrongylus costaricensis TaxID=334426 RepID=A0A0R3PK19_ANGCS|nr:unnamed protein product [Angiostrongylus costaricensis]
MRVGLILSLISSFQIFQQTVISELRFVDRKSLSFSLASASFSLGQFISTLFLACQPISARKGLVADAWLLIIGSVIAAAPRKFWSVMCVGRFLVGCGAGLGFVCSTLILYDSIPYSARPSHFLVLGLSFAFATVVINVTPLINIPDTGILILASVISASCGIIYLLLHPHPGFDSEGLQIETYRSRPSSFPSTLVYVLMALNVVRFVVSKSLTGNLWPENNHLYHLYLSAVVPKFLIVGGYLVAVFIQATLLLTSFYPYLPDEVRILSFLKFFLVSVPCNTALCLITEQFASSNEQMTFASRGRCVMWILATISTATFSWTMENYGFLICFVPYVVVSTALLLLLIWIYPKTELEII